MATCKSTSAAPASRRIEVVYDQIAQRLQAPRGATLNSPEPDGKITYGQVIDLTDDYIATDLLIRCAMEAPDDTAIQRRSAPIARKVTSR